MQVLTIMRDIKQLTGCQTTCSFMPMVRVHDFRYNSGGKLKKFLADIQIWVDVVTMICDYLINFSVIMVVFVHWFIPMITFYMLYKSIDKSSVTIYLTLLFLFVQHRAAGSFYCPLALNTMGFYWQTRRNRMWGSNFFFWQTFWGNYLEQEWAQP